ncbi:DUF4238 domain-containing protein [Arthrobacter sp. YAF16]|uniref:DUF4238 domain-containing protein n=1 Tax=Arthrobacter sp. YAF16 TaxID=3233076 RepID=UPI003F9304EB
MPLHHYIPAAYLGGFSASIDGPRRSRPIWCLRRGSAAPFRTLPSRVGAVHDLYTLHEMWEPDSLDEVWSHYERQLPRATEALTADPTTLTAPTWLQVLVPFATSLFVRGAEFGPRYSQRNPMLTDMAEGRTADHISNGRIFEFQRLLAPVTAAEWTLLDAADSGGRFITNDLGLTPVGHAKGAPTPGYVIPLSPRFAVMLTPVRQRWVMVWRDGAWRTLMARHSLAAADVTAINASTASFATEFLIAPNPEALTAATTLWSGPPEMDWLTAGWTGTREEKAAHEFDWHRLARLADEPLTPAMDLQELGLAEHWSPPLLLPVNLPDFRSGLHQHGPAIFLELGPRRFPD